MMYKIGNLEVEAVQWKGDNVHELIQLREAFLNSHHVSRDRIFSLGSLSLCVGQYLVVTKHNSLFKLSEQDFNDMTTKLKEPKLKEPKFKVGDTVYFIDCWLSDAIKLMKGLVVSNEGIYYLDGRMQVFSESELLTLEEAIEKLKEL